MRLELPENCCARARQLIAEGLDPVENLEFFRGEMLCLRGPAWAFAKLQVRENERVGPVFVRWKDTLGPFLRSQR
jgi:hypothetical protein